MDRSETELLRVGKLFEVSKYRPKVQDDGVGILLDPIEGNPSRRRVQEGSLRSDKCTCTLRRRVRAFPTIDGTADGVPGVLRETLLFHPLSNVGGLSRLEAVLERIKEGGLVGAVSRVRVHLTVASNGLVHWKMTKVRIPDSSDRPCRFPEIIPDSHFETLDVQGLVVQIGKGFPVVQTVEK